MTIAHVLSSLFLAWQLLAPAVVHADGHTPRSLADDLQALQEIRVSHYRLFSDCKHCVPNEHEFYFFDRGLKGKTGTLLSVGTFRSLENASRGNFDRAFLLDIDEEAVRFNNRQIKTLAETPYAIDFIPRFLREPDLFDLFPEWRDLYAQGKFKELALQIRTKKRPGKLKIRSLPLERYVVQLLLYCENVPKWQVSFLCDQDRYHRLHRMAAEDRLHAVRVDMGGDTMAALNRVLQAHGQQVSTLDLSNVSDYIREEQLEKYKKNLASIPWAPNANIQMTILPPETGWYYYDWRAEDFIDALKDFEIEGFFHDQMRDQLYRARYLNDCSGLLR